LEVRILHNTGYAGDVVVAQQTSPALVIGEAGAAVSWAAVRDADQGDRVAARTRRALVIGRITLVAVEHAVAGMLVAVGAGRAGSVGAHAFSACLVADVVLGTVFRCKAQVDALAGHFVAVLVDGIADVTAAVDLDTTIVDTDNVRPRAVEFGEALVLRLAFAGLGIAAR